MSTNKKVYAQALSIEEAWCTFSFDEKGEALRRLEGELPKILIGRPVLNALLKALRAAAEPAACKTCGGTRVRHSHTDGINYETEPCPDCNDGRL